MTFLKRVLDPPSYGFERDGKLYVPTQGELFREFARRLNAFRDRRNWLVLFCWAATLAFAAPLWIFFRYYFSFTLLAIGLVYSLVVLASFGTFWFHRYGTHRAFRFRSPWIRTLCRNAVIKTIPEEVYIISHHVHHQFSEEPGDPYNVHAGWLYCFLADATHQNIAKNLSEKDYALLCRLITHTGVRVNDYATYLRWGTLCHPFYTVLHYALNWACWYGILYLMGGHRLATAIFGLTGLWAVGIRTFNYEGHGKGKDLRREGSDFNRRDLSVNQHWPGIVAGEWHNNHHLYPNGARSGFQWYQLDLPWYAIRALSAIGAVSSFRDYKEDFVRDHLAPYLARVRVREPVVAAATTGAGEG